MHYPKNPVQIGEVFTRLTVIETGLRAKPTPTQARKGYSGNRSVICMCSCGNTLQTLEQRLRKGETTSCGCFNKEVVALNAIKAGNANKKEVCGYFAAHDRIRTARGKASDYVCSCGKQAKDWSYTHQDINELTAIIKTPQGDEILVSYSLDSSFYVALCKKCHLAFDRK